MKPKNLAEFINGMDEVTQANMKATALHLLEVAREELKKMKDELIAIPGWAPEYKLLGGARICSVLDDYCAGEEK